MTIAAGSGVGARFVEVASSVIGRVEPRCGLGSNDFDGDRRLDVAVATGAKVPSSPRVLVQGAVEDASSAAGLSVTNAVRIDWR